MPQRKMCVIEMNRGENYIEMLTSSGYELQDRTVLDVGCEHGEVLMFFSKKSAETIGLDINKDFLRIAKKKAKNSSQENFNALVANGKHLPLKDECVDIVLMIGALEFVPLRDPYSEPKETHLEALKGIKRILRKNGALLLGIENRYWIGFWFGIKDHHTGMRFITILPRRIANFIYKRKKGTPFYLERTYSYFELNEILTNAGFTIQKKFTALPSWGCNKEIPDIDNKSDFNQKIDSIETWKPFIYELYSICLFPKVFWKILNSLGLAKFFCSNLIYVSKKKT